MKPVIVHIIQHLRPGGIETLVMEMLKRNRKFDFHIIALEGKVVDALKQFPLLNQYSDYIHCLEKSDGIQWRTVRSLRVLLKSLKPVACVSHHIGPLLYTTLAKPGLAIQHLHTEHDAWHLNDPAHERLQYWCLKIAQPTVIADAQIVADILHEKFQFIQPQLIHNGIDTERFKPGCQSDARDYFNLPQDKKLIGCAARLEPVKQVHRLINALTELPTDVHLVIAGTGSEHLSLLRQVADLKLGRRVHFLGYQTNLEIFYQAIDVFCLVSRHEGFPLSSLEAQACNVPVILSNVGGSSETVCRETGVLLDSEDNAQLVSAISYQVNRSKLDSPRKFIEQYFTIETMLDKYEQLVSEVTYKQEVA